MVARPTGRSTGKRRSLADLAAHWNIDLDKSQQADLSELPPLLEGHLSGSGTLLALEAKAAMTAHAKAAPRLYDELNSSHLTVHGASSQAIAVGLVMVNASETFISPERQSEGSRSELSIHKQPDDVIRIINKVKEIKRRSGTGPWL